MEQRADIGVGIEEASRIGVVSCKHTCDGKCEMSAANHNRGDAHEYSRSAHKTVFSAVCHGRILANSTQPLSNNLAIRRVPHRILHIIPTLDAHGAEKQLSLLATGLPGERFDVHVCALTRSGPYEAKLRDAGIPVVVIGKRWKLDPAAYSRLKRHIAQLKPDLVHTWLFAANSYGRAAALAAGVRHVVASERCSRSLEGLARAGDRSLSRSAD